MTEYIEYIQNGTVRAEDRMSLASSAAKAAPPSECVAPREHRTALATSAANYDLSTQDWCTLTP